ncbi:MAG: thioredoxin domain-containing protein, partial [Aquificales bacterium]|nr:thioredoxin domain-containing protein [Aquificales bacterium]
MHDLLFARPQEWSNRNANDAFIRFAEEMGLDSDNFTACVEEGRYSDQIQADFEYGLSKGVSSTPYFFVNEQPLVGAQPVNIFNEAIATVMDGGELANAQPEAPPEPTRVEVADEGIAAILGSDDAPYTIVEFTNFGCENCADHVFNTLPKVQEYLIDSGQIRYLLKDLPGESGSPEVQTAAIAARCAGEQDTYWKMHDSLFNNQAKWLGSNEADAVFSSLAGDLALDADTFAECVTSGKFDITVVDGIHGSIGGVLAVGVFPEQLKLRVGGDRCQGSDLHLVHALALPVFAQDRFAQSHNDLPVVGGQ